MSEKSVIFTFRNFDWALATSIEIINDQVSKGNFISWAHWTERLDFPKEFPIYETLKNSRFKKKIFSSNLLSGLNKGSQIQLVKFLSIEKVNSHMSKDLSVLSQEGAYLELISRRRESAPDKNKHMQTLTRLQNSYLKTYSAAHYSLSKDRPSFVYLFNGRFLQEKAVADCCKQMKIPVIFFERFNPSWLDKYFLFYESTHSPKYRSRAMLEFFDNTEDTLQQSLIKIGEKWFSDRALGLTQNFTKAQNSTLIRKTNKPFFVFFHSSEDELITTDLISSIWLGQISALKSLVSVINSIGTHDLVIRIHPNLSHKSNDEIDLWNRLAHELTILHPWITFLAYDNNVNSYSLIDRSDGVITVGSTIGVEAAFKEKKSILLGRAFHEDMDITLNPKNEAELRNFLLMTIPSPEIISRRSNAVKYAVFHALGGIKYTSVEVKGGRRLKYYYGHLSLSNSDLFALLLKTEILVRKKLQTLTYFLRRK
jgi:hypothetical protein